MRELITWIYRGAVERIFAATRAFPTMGRRGARVDDPESPIRQEQHVSVEREQPPMHDQQHVNPAERLERGHPKR